MSVTIELTPENQDRFSALAKQQGMSLPEYLSRILSTKVVSQTASSPADRARLWRETVLGLAGDVVLPDDAMQREGFYDDRG